MYLQMEQPNAHYAVKWKLTPSMVSIVYWASSCTYMRADISYSDCDNHFRSYRCSMESADLAFTIYSIGKFTCVLCRFERIEGPPKLVQLHLTFPCCQYNVLSTALTLVWLQCYHEKRRKYPHTPLHIECRQKEKVSSHSFAYRM